MPGPAYARPGSATSSARASRFTGSRKGAATASSRRCHAARLWPVSRFQTWDCWSRPARLIAGLGGLGEALLRLPTTQQARGAPPATPGRLRARGAWGARRGPPSK
jgi:hypothetical protein